MNLTNVHGQLNSLLCREPFWKFISSVNGLSTYIEIVYLLSENVF